MPSGDPDIQAIVGRIIKGAAHDLRPADPLNAELWASHILGLWYKRLPPEIDEECLLVEAILLAAERRRDAASLAVCRAFAVVTDEAHAGELNTQADRLAALGLPEPKWAPAIGRPAFVEAWRGMEAFGDTDVIVAVFRYEGFGDHALTAMIDYNLDSILKDAVVVAPAHEIVTHWHSAPGIRLERIDAAGVASRLRPALEMTDSFFEPPVYEGFEHFRGLVAGRLRLALPDVKVEPGDDEPMAVEERDRLVAEFLASPFAPAEPAVREHAERVAELAVDFKCDYSDGDPLRWSPVAVELFLCDWAPRKAILSKEEVAALPDALRGWVRFALRRRGLGDDAIAGTMLAVDELEDEFRRAAGDPSRYGPAKAIMDAMLADGVDPSDQAVVDAWITRFNARPEPERRRILG